MSFASLRGHALSLTGATEDIKWQVDWVASVGAKMFLIGGPEPRWKACSFKVDEHRFLELSDQPGFAPAPYLARAKWVQLRDPKALALPELKALIERSYALILAKLTLKVRKELLP